MKESIVYFTKNITSENIVEIYKKLNISYWIVINMLE